MAVVVAIKLDFTKCGRPMSISQDVPIPDSALSARNRIICGFTGKFNGIITVDDGNDHQIDITASSFDKTVDVDSFFAKLCATAAGSATVPHAHAV